MIRLTTCAAILATGGLAVGQDLTPIPAAPYSPPAALPAPSYEAAPRYEHAPAYPTVDPVPVYPAAPAHAAPVYGGPAYGGAGYGPVPPAYPLARNVKYEDLKNIAPCAVPQTVCVNGECGPVLVEICAPEGCVVVERKRHKTRYEYGDYAVDIKQKRGRIVVDYDD